MRLFINNEHGHDTEHGHDSAAGGPVPSRASYAQRDEFDSHACYQMEV